MNGRTQQTKVLSFIVRQNEAARNPIFAKWHNQEMFAVPQKGRYRRDNTVPICQQGQEGYCMLCVWTKPIFAYVPCAAENNI